MENKPGPNLKKLGLLTLIVGDLLGYTGSAVGLGYLAWQKLKLPWWILLVTTLLGLFLAFLKIYQISKKELD